MLRNKKENIAKVIWSLLLLVLLCTMTWAVARTENDSTEELVSDYTEDASPEEPVPAPSAIGGDGTYATPYTVETGADLYSLFTNQIASKAGTNAKIWVELKGTSMTLNGVIPTGDTIKGVRVPYGVEVMLVTNAAGDYGFTIYTQADKRHFEILGDGKLCNGAKEHGGYSGNITLSGRTAYGIDDAGRFQGGGVFMHRGGVTANEITNSVLDGFIFRHCSDEAAYKSDDPTVQDDVQEAGIVNIWPQHTSNAIALNQTGLYDNAVNIINCTFEENRLYGTNYENMRDGEYWWRSACIFTHGDDVTEASIAKRKYYFGNTVIQNCVFKNNRGENKSSRTGRHRVDGTGIHSVEGAISANILIDGCTFTENTNTDKGAAVCVAGNCTIKNSTFTKNVAGAAGGAVSIMNSFLSDTVSEIEGCTFTENSSSGNGGAIAIVQEASLNQADSTEAQKRRNDLLFLSVKNSSFEKNSTINGGGGAVYSSNCTTVLENCDFLYNEVSGSGSHGGAVAIQRFGIAYLSGYQSSVTNCKFIENKAIGTSTNGRGGALFLGNSNAMIGTTPVDEIPITNCIFEENTAQRGGAIYLNSTAEVMSEPYKHLIPANRVINFRRGTATGATRITQNQAHVDGGGIYVNIRGHINVQGFELEMTGNYAAGNGGGIYMDSTSQTVSTINADTADSQLTIQGKLLPGSVSRNASYGGGIYVAGTRVLMHTANQGKILVDGNTALYGGGISTIAALYVYNQVNAVGSEGSITISNNTAEAAGGGASILQNGTLIFRGAGETQMMGNTAKSSAGHGGGGIYAFPNASVSINDNGRLRLRKNDAVQYNSTGGHGGGVYLSSTSGFRAESGTSIYVEENTAERDGGGFYVARDNDNSGADDARNKLYLLGSVTFDKNEAWKVFDYPLGTAMLTSYLQRVITDSNYYNDKIAPGATRTVSPIRQGAPMCYHLYNNLDIYIYIPDIDLDIKKEYINNLVKEQVDMTGNIKFNVFTETNGTMIRILEVVVDKNGNQISRQLYPDLSQSQRDAMPSGQAFPYGTYWIEEDSGGYFKADGLDLSVPQGAVPQPVIHYDKTVDAMKFTVEYGPDGIQTKTITVTAGIKNDYNHNTVNDSLLIKKILSDGKTLTDEDQFQITLTPHVKNGSGGFDKIDNLPERSVTLDGQSPQASLPGTSGTDSLAYGVWYQVSEKTVPKGYKLAGITVEGEHVTNNSNVYVIARPGVTGTVITVENLVTEESITIHIRQIALIDSTYPEKKGVLHVPKQGYATVENRTSETAAATYNYPAIINGGADYNLPAYETVVLEWKSGTDIFTFAPIIPMNYKLHQRGIEAADNIQMNNPKKYITAENDKLEWWVDIYLVPSDSGWEKPYSKDEKVNVFGPFKKE